MQNHVAGEVTINTVSMYTQKGVLNMTEHVQSLIIQESILSPGITAELIVWDTMNIAGMLPILGSEKLYIEFTTPGRKTAKYDLRLAIMSEAEIAPNMRTKSYRLMAVSPEAVTNKARRVTKAYKTNVSNMVEDILTSHLHTKKKVDVQQTRGIQTVIIPDIRPFQAIKMLRHRSTSSTDKSSSYVFFENQEGFHFKTLEKLFKDIQIDDREFYNDPSSNIDIKKPIFRNIIDYSIPNQFDIMHRLDKGGLAKEIQKFDYKTLEYTKSISSFEAADYESADGTSNDPDNELFKTNYGQTAGTSIWVAHDSGNPDTFISDGSGGLSSGTSMYQQGILWLSIFGDSELTAGQGIKTNIVENSTATQAPELSTQHSGKYIIGAIRHEIGPSGTNPRYTCSLECIKGAYKDTRK